MYCVTEIRQALLVTKGTKVADAGALDLRLWKGAGANCQEWAKFHAAFGTGPLVTFSRVGLSDDLTQAVVVMQREDCAWGRRELFILNRTSSNGWAVLYWLSQWSYGD